MKDHIFKKKLSLLSFIAISTFFILIVFFVLKISNFSERHWTSFYDHEITLLYNSLLFNSGIKHEYVDHSGYFTILFLSIFLKIIEFLNFINISSFTDFSREENIDENFQSLIIFTRIFAALSVSIFLILIHYIYYFFSKNNFLSVILTIITFSSLGSIMHTIQLRTEVVAMIFFLLAFINLRLFFNKNKFYYFILFLLFFYCSVLNKSQVFLFLPVILILAKLNENNFDEINTNEYKFLENKYFKFIIIGIFISYLLLKFLSTPQSNILSPIFIILMVLFINVFFYYCFKKNQLNLEKNLVIINFSIIFVYFIFKNFLFIHPSTNELAFVNTFTNVMTNTKYISSKLEFLTFILLNKNQLILLLISILLSVVLKKKIGNEIFKFNLLCLFVFIYISLIHLLRPNMYYLIFSEFFLLLSFCGYGKYLNLRNYYIPTIFAVIILVLQIQEINNYLNTIKHNQISKLCNDTYLYDWHKKINKKKFKKFCKNSLN